MLQLGATADDARAGVEARACAREKAPAEALAAAGATAAAGAEGEAGAGAGAGEASVAGQPLGQQGPVADGAPEGAPDWGGALRLFEVGDDAQAEQQLLRLWRQHGAQPGALSPLGAPLLELARRRLGALVRHSSSAARYTPLASAVSERYPPLRCTSLSTAR